MGDDQRAERAFQRSRPSVSEGPTVTYAILAVTVIISLVTLFGAAELESWLLLDKGAIYYGDEYWRLLTVALVHGSIIHLGFNMYALWIIGPIVEALYGPWRFLAIYLVCIAAGSVASYATSANPAVGASGGVFGLFGVLLVADRVHKPALTRNARNMTTQIGMLIGINLLIGFTIPGIDNAAHIGGLLAGAVLGLLVVPQGARLDSFWSRPSGDPVSPTGQRPEPVARTRPLRILGVGALVAVIVGLAVVGPISYEPPLWWLLAGQPLMPTEPLGDAIAIAASQASALLGHGRPRLDDLERQVQHLRASRRGLGALVTQQQPQPGGHAAAQLQAVVDGPAVDGIRPPKAVAA